MTETELRELAHLVNKYRSAFAWNFGKNKDQTGAVSDAMLADIRQTIRNGGTYYDEQFLIQKVKT
jgi:hypothetical protein